MQYLTKRSGPGLDWVWTQGPVCSPAGPGPIHLGPVQVQTWVCQVQDQPLDSLNAMTMHAPKSERLGGEVTGHQICY